jgi:hypothetical protein
MSDQDGFDARLAAHFEREHRHVPDDGFVAATMQKVRTGRRRRGIMRISLRAVALAAVVAASPWLNAGVDYLDAALESSLGWAAELPTWALGAVAFVILVATRLRRR